MPTNKYGGKKMEDEHPREFVGVAGEKTKGTQEEFYRFQLRQAKLARIEQLGAATGLAQEEIAALNAMGDREKIELKTLARLYALTDSSPEYLQVKAITGGDSREEIAEKLASIYMERILVESTISRFIAPTSASATINAGLQNTRNNFDLFGQNQ
jgi:hypothetical protein